MIIKHVNYFKKRTKNKNLLVTVLNSHKTNTTTLSCIPDGSVNTSIVTLAAFHTRYAVTVEAHFGRRIHITRPSPTIGPFNDISAGLSGTLNGNLKYHSIPLNGTKNTQYH